MQKDHPSNLTKCFARTNEVVTRQIAGEIVVVPVRAGAADLDFVYSSNETGARIWQSMDGQRNLQQIIQILCTEYDVSQQEAAEGVANFVAALEEAGLVCLVQEKV